MLFMRRCKILIMSLVAVPGLSLYSETTVESKQPTPPSPSMEHIASPSGKVLPKGVERFRLVHAYKTATSGYDVDGKEQNIGLTFMGAGTAVVAEYGITSALSFQMVAPFAYRNQLVLDKNKFSKTDAFKSNQQKLVQSAAEKLAQSQVCANKDACVALIASGAALPFDMGLQADTGEYYVIKAGESLQKRIDEQLIAAAEPVKDGQVGLGDIETGLLYNVYADKRIYISTGLGLRSPTGQKGLPAMRPNSGRVYDLGLRTNLDFCPINGLWVGLQSQFENALSKGTWTRPSMLDKTKPNSADPFDGGDRMANSQSYEKKGVMQEHMLKASLGLGAVSDSLKSLGLTSTLTHRQDRKIVIGGKESSKASMAQDASVSGTVSGLPYKIPVELEMKYSEPLAGKNRVLAMSQFESILYVYARF